MEPSRQLIEAASWRLVAEILRRHPYLRVMETHPGGGQYDCLSILLGGGASEPRSQIALNRLGSVHFFRGADHLDHWPEFWSDYLSAPDPRRIVSELCAKAGLPAVTHLPASTPAVVVYRFIAAFLASTILGRENWECRNGFHDSSGMEGSFVSRESFAAFPAALARLSIRLADDPLDQPACRFWFICKSGKPQLCLETMGRAWDLKGAEFDLMKLYRVRRRIWPVVSFVAGDLLP